jgi:UDP-N-acetylglucosamine--N-acetylmuramyl-(pentapeptide) pyrophosphoryl-undecaprenol N-acetylglucosamine transferase
MMTRKIVLTGGHAATTALAVVEELIRRKEKINWEIYWIGTKYALEGKKTPTLEFEIFPEKGVIFRPIITGRIQRRFTLWTIPSLVKMPFGFFHAFKEVISIKPDLILSFGGFAAFPVVLAGWLRRIPIILHEQTAAIGRANLFSAFFARKILLARQESIPHFPKKKISVTGNPIMTQIAEIVPKEKVGDPPVIFVTGGSRGSQNINEIIDKFLEKILDSYYLIHQTGHLDFKYFEKRREKMPEKLKANYEIYDRVDPMKIDNLYRQADLVIARAGANTTSEIMAVKRPAILIPLPWAFHNEQRKNAEFAEKFGIAEILEEKEAEKKLLGEVEKILTNWNEIVERVKDRKSPDIKAAENVVNEIEDFFK